jgi:phage terminase small subunit
MPKKIRKTETKLNPRQEMFCQLYASDREFFGNGTQSYIEAFDLTPNRYGTARTNASLLLTKTNILKRIDELLEIYINDQVVDKELGFVVLQKADLSAKVAAIREYNKLKKRVDSNSIEIENLTITNNQYNAIIQREAGRLNQGESEKSN